MGPSLLSAEAGCCILLFWGSRAKPRHYVTDIRHQVNRISPACLKTPTKRRGTWLPYNNLANLVSLSCSFENRYGTVFLIPGCHVLDKHPHCILNTSPGIQMHCRHPKYMSRHLKYVLIHILGCIWQYIQIYSHI